MQEAATADANQQTHRPAVFGGDHFAFVFDEGRYIELHGASQSELDRFKREHPSAPCHTVHGHILHS